MHNKYTANLRVPHRADAEGFHVGLHSTDSLLYNTRASKWQYVHFDTNVRKRRMAYSLSWNMNHVRY